MEKNYDKVKHSTGQKITFIIHIVLTVILAIIVLNCVFLVAESFLYGDKIPGFFSLKPGAEGNETMEPTIRMGDFIILNSVGNRELSEGDVISYRTGGGFAIGRILTVNGNVFMVKGDAEADKDAVPVQIEEIRGVWNGFRIPILGYLFLCMRTVPGFILILLILLLLDGIMSVYLRRKASKSDDEDLRSLTEDFALCGTLCLGNWILFSKGKRGASAVKSERRRRNE